MRNTLLLLLFTLSILKAQTGYFPPISSENWDSMPASQLGWPQDRIDSLYRFLETKNTKSFMVLKDGKRVLEHYFDNFQRDSVWYWASAGKSAAAFLVGMAQDEGLLNIQDKTSDYLGMGWTVCTPAQEDSITIWHQITMTTGLDDGLPPSPQIPAPQDCLDDSCLQYLAPAGSRWAYHNAPYRLVQDVVASASNMSFNQYTRTRLLNRTGMKGFWFDHILFGRARDMARFGLLVLRNGVWEQDSLIRDQAYVQAMSRPSQSLNESYGYLWWLNGQSSFMLPSLQLRFPGSLVPNAPSDMFAALGKNDQKIYVVPSLDMVVVRQGNAANDPLAGPSSFDNDLWEIINWLDDGTTNLYADNSVNISLFPNPASNEIHIHSPKIISKITIIDIHGREHFYTNTTGKTQLLNIEDFAPGLYTCIIQGENWHQAERFIKQ